MRSVETRSDEVRLDVLVYGPEEELSIEAALRLRASTMLTTRRCVWSL